MSPHLRQNDSCMRRDDVLLLSALTWAASLSSSAKVEIPLRPHLSIVHRRGRALGAGEAAFLATFTDKCVASANGGDGGGASDPSDTGPRLKGHVKELAKDSRVDANAEQVAPGQDARQGATPNSPLKPNRNRPS